MKLHFAVTDYSGHNQTKNRIYNGEDEFQPNNIRQMLVQKKIVLRNIFIVIVGYPNIEQNIQ